MAFEDTYRLSVHAVITDSDDRLLQLKATYGGNRWGLPGGALDPGETIHQALSRECLEEMGVEIKILYMSGMYYHSAYHSHALIFRCEFPDDAKITLSEEHSAFKYFDIDTLGEIQKRRVLECLNFDGEIQSAAF